MNDPLRAKIEECERLLEPMRAEMARLEPELLAGLENGLRIARRALAGENLTDEELDPLREFLATLDAPTADTDAPEWAQPLATRKDET